MRTVIWLVMVALLAGACASPNPSPSFPAATARPSTPESSDPRSSVIPGVVPAPHWPIPGIDAGNTATPTPGANGQIDTAWGWGSLEWSPDGQILAAAALSQEDGEGQIHLFDRTGHPIGALPGWAAAWIDDHDLMTAERNADGASDSSWRWSVDAKSSELVDPATGGFLSNGRGSVAFARSSAADIFDITFRMWTSQDGLGAVLPGQPAAWSADGRKLAVQHDAATAAAPSQGGVTLTAGGVPPTWLEVLDGSTLRRVAAFPKDAFDGRTTILFDPTGTFVAAFSFVFDLAHTTVVNLPTGDEAVAWAADGRLLVASTVNDAIYAWDPASDALGPAFATGARLRTSDGQLVVVPPRSGDLPIQLVTSGISPDGALRAWYPNATGDGPTPLWLVPAQVPTP
jgi:hypothetical protein